MADFEEGEWVRVWAQVAQQDQVHPEDLVVRLESHNADYEASVRRDRASHSEETPDFALTCTRVKEFSLRHLGSLLLDGPVLIRCQEVDRHGGEHRNGEIKWPESETTGYIEEA